MMKKILLMCCFLLGISAVSFAQGGMRRSPEERVKQMKEALKLTDDQSAKVLAIYQTQAKSVDSLRNAGGGREGMMSLMQSSNAKIQAILTTEQKAAYEKMMAEMRDRARQGQGGGTPPPSQK